MQIITPFEFDVVPDVKIKTLQNQWACSVAGFDVDKYDLSQYPADMFSYTSLTKWGKIPKGFNPKRVLEDGKNAGLQIRELHKKGIDGSTMTMAIIDAPLMAHPEYQDNVVHYEAFGYGEDPYASMHASAVSSIAIGQTCGVAPKAKLYFFAANSFEKYRHDGMYTSKDKQTYQHHIEALQRILEINKHLPAKRKISIVSVSWDLTEPKSDDYSQIKAVLDACKKAGIFVNHTGIERQGLLEHGLDRDIQKSPDDALAYKKACFLSDKYTKDTLCFPMCHRTVASHIRPDEYIHESAGGWSWIKPYESALFLLAKQVNPNITFEEFWAKGLVTGCYNKKIGATVVQPIQLITELQKEMKQVQSKPRSLKSILKKHSVKQSSFTKQITRI